MSEIEIPMDLKYSARKEPVKFKLQLDLEWKFLAPLKELIEANDISLRHQLMALMEAIETEIDLGRRENLGNYIANLKGQHYVILAIAQGINEAEKAYYEAQKEEDARKGIIRL